MSAYSPTDKRSDSKTVTFFKKFFRKRDDNFSTKNFEEEIVSPEFERTLKRLTKDLNEYDITESSSDESTPTASPKQEEVVLTPTPGKRQDLQRVENQMIEIC